MDFIFLSYFLIHRAARNFEISLKNYLEEIFKVFSLLQKYTRHCMLKLQHFYISILRVSV